VSGQTNPRSADLVLAFALAIVAPMISGLIAVGSALVAWSLGRPPAVSPAVLLVLAVGPGSIVASRFLKRWPSGRIHSSTWLALCGAIACGAAYAAGVALAPWPDLLSDEVAQAGQVRFYYEMVKTGIPFLVAGLLVFGLLRHEPQRLMV
jgi:hypothetical protein